jgi:hypothetical protein
VCASAVVKLDTPCSEVVWRVLATHSSRQFSLHFPSRASPCGMTFQLDSVSVLMSQTRFLLPVRPHYCHRNIINRYPVRQIRASFQASISILCLLYIWCSMCILKYCISAKYFVGVEAPTLK